MGNSIRIKLKRMKNSKDCFSRLFGSPIIPFSLKDDVESLGEDVMFFGEFRLSDIVELDSENKLPHEGYLYLFLDITSSPYKVISFYTKDKPGIIMGDFNKNVSKYEDYTVPFSMSFEKADGGIRKTKLFGTPSRDCCGELFMQFNPIDNASDFLSDVDGYAFIIFSDSKRSLDKLRFTVAYL